LAGRSACPNKPENSIVVRSNVYNSVMTVAAYLPFCGSANPIRTALLMEYDGMLTPWVISPSNMRRLDRVVVE